MIGSAIAAHVCAPVEKVAVSDDAVFRELAKRMEPKLRKRFLEIVGWLRERQTLDEISDLITTAGLQEAFAEDAAKAGAALAEAVGVVYLAAGREVAAAISEGMDTLVALDQANPRAVRALARTKMRIAAELSEDVREVAREVIRDHLRRGINPRVSARVFRDSIGLTVKQYRHVENYRGYLENLDSRALERELRDARFDRTIRRAIKTGKPLTKAQIDKMVERYRKNYIAFRAETIARTESLGALSWGADDGWWQAIESGALTKEELEGEWITSIDGRQRDSHGAMDGQRRPFGEPFVSGDGYELRFPHDPDAPLRETAQCRCRRVVRVKRAAASATQQAA